VTIVTGTLQADLPVHMKHLYTTLLGCGSTRNSEKFARVLARTGRHNVSELTRFFLLRKHMIQAIGETL